VRLVAARPSVQPPAGVERKAALYAARPERQAVKAAKWVSKPVEIRSEARRLDAGMLDKFRQPYGQLDTLPQLFGSAACR
jgi:hypothetical protein